MSIIQRLKDKNLYINFGIFIAAIIVLLLLLTQVLRWYTHHGESLTVPDLKGMNIDEVKRSLSDRELRYEIKDSVFAPDKPKLSVIDQNPKAGSKVKRNRRIYLIINADKAPKVALPNLNDNVPLRQAVRILESNGLKQGKISYKPDIALNAVLEMYYQGRKVMPGDLVDKGSAIDLVLGDGGQTAKVAVPDLTGKSLDEALIILRGNNLVIGAVNKVNVKDSTTAIIFKQKPLAGGNNVPQGEAVDIWLKDK